MHVSPRVAESFQKRLDTVLELIETASITYDEIGIFGSYARDEYKATSDIDICIVTDNKPHMRISGELREQAEELRVDIIFVSHDFINNSQEPMALQLRKDYRRIR